MAGKTTVLTVARPTVNYFVVLKVKISSLKSEVWHSNVSVANTVFLFLTKVFLCILGGFEGMQLCTSCLSAYL